MLKLRNMAICLGLVAVVGLASPVRLLAAGEIKVEEIIFKNAVLEITDEEIFDISSETGKANWQKFLSVLWVLDLDVEFFEDTGSLLIYDPETYVFPEIDLEVYAEDTVPVYDNTIGLEEIPYGLEDFILPAKELLAGGWYAQVNGVTTRLYFTADGKAFAMELDEDYGPYTVSGTYSFDEEGLLVFVYNRVYENGVLDPDMVEGEVWYLSNTVRLSPDGEYLYMDYDDMIMTRNEDTKWLQRNKF